MPTYEYICSHCKHRFEQFQTMTAAPLRKCPECGAPVKRQIGAGAGLLFKGDGFRATSKRAEPKTQRPGCGREKPCCGRSQRCGKHSCERS